MSHDSPATGSWGKALNRKTFFWLVVDLPILKNMLVNGKDDIPYMKWKIKNVPNHQPVLDA
jgi:hypothetical protein